jgi:hypothetical protein
MAYTINLTNGTIFATVADGTINNASSMTLVGKNYAGYGEFLDENFIHLLENSANTTAPASPLTGQLWWDSTNALMKVYNGTAFKVMTGSTSSASAPSNVITGDLWWDTTNSQLKIYNGASWTVVGPAYTSAEGTAGAIPETITDSGATPHYVTSLYVNNTRVAIVSKDASFVPSAPTITTFPNIYNGITLYNTSSPVYAGTATNAQLLDSLDSTDFMRATANTSTTGTVAILNNFGLTVGASNVFAVNTTSTDANIKSNISNGNLVIQANVGGTTYNVARAVGTTGVFAVSNAMTAGTTVSAVGNVTGGNIVTAGQVTATANITGGNIISAAAVSGVSLVSSGNVDSGNLRTAGQISAAGNITSAANVAGTYFIGNGSALTGLSLGVSVTKFVNGTSEGNVGTSGGNINFNVGGVSNVVVIDTSTLYANVLSAQSITKSGTNAVGNIGSSSSFFNTVFGNIYNGTVISVAGNVTGANINTGGLVSAGTTVSATGNITGGNLITAGLVSTASITKTGSNAVGNIGSSSNYFNQVFATATTALYADVAERFAADEVLEPGTVVELGGSQEITRAVTDLSENVFGVISTRPAYTMNGGAGEDSTHPKVAMTGRVPVNVIGIIRKGDRLVAAGAGLARAAQSGEATAFNVIGRSLVDKTTTQQGTVEAIVTIKN